MEIHSSRVRYSFLAFLLAFEGCMTSDSNPERLCTLCWCENDKTTWLLETAGGEDPVEGSNRPDPNALLANCSGQQAASPFAGAYEWPDVPIHVSREDQAHGPKVTDLPVTRADFSNCGLSGGLRPLPARETRRLRELSLSRNGISWIQSGVFSGLPALRFLDLSNNKLDRFPEDSLPLVSDPSMASKLEVVLLAQNDLMKVPWEVLLRMPMLKRLDLSSNFIDNLKDGFAGKPSDLIFESIKFPKVVNFRHNQLAGLSVEVASRFPRLMELDLSWNRIKSVPEAIQLGTDLHFSNLSVLNLDGNLIKRLGPNSFVGSPSLRTLSVSATTSLYEISSEAFDELPGLKSLSLRRNILLTHLPKEGILGKSRSGKWAVEEVDLSYNSLEYISEDFLPWKEIKKVNVQGNPWNCNCSLQWMLDSFMPHVYKVNSSLLMDLRCYKPKWLQGRRFVHWLDRSSGVYCGNMIERLRMKMAPTEVEDVGVVATGMSTGMIASLVAIGVLVVGLTVTAVILQRRANRQERDLRTKNYLCRNPRY